jgi:glycosyltransferase involved in cell wall biosynthesis
MTDIIITSYKRYNNIQIILNSFIVQTRQDFNITVIHDGYDEKMESILKGFKEQYPDKIDYKFTEQRYNDYGHTLRDMGIQNAKGDTILITNDDNYYCNKFLEIMLSTMHGVNADLVFCDMIHGHKYPGGRMLPEFSFFETRPSRGNIDIGCFITKTELAKQVGFRDKSHDGDATYFEDLIKSKNNFQAVKVNQVLFYHN